MATVASSEISLLTRVTSRHILEQDILHSHWYENSKSFKEFTLYDRLVNSFIMLKSDVFSFHSKDVAGGRHTFRFIKSPYIFMR
jgi:hypothetical protein